MDRAKAALYWNTLTRMSEVVRFRWNVSAPIDELLGVQMRLLKRRLMHAWRHNPLYRERMDAANLDRGDIEQLASTAELERFPVITKRDLSDPLETVLSRGYEPKSLVRSQTAGSTGRPLIFYVDHNERFKRRYVGIRNNLNITGCRPEDTHVLLSHYEPVKPGEGYHVYKTKMLNRLFLNVPHRVIQISPYEDMERRARILETLQPDVVQASVWDLYSLAQCVRRSAPKSILRPRLSIFGMGWMPDYMLEEIQEILHTETRGVYGSREFGDFAAQCEFEKYHYSIDAVVVECVDSQGRPVPPGRVGRLLITDLYNYATPFIRYEIGDMAVLAPLASQCECGCKLPMIERLEGRIADLVVKANGEKIVPSFFWNEWRQEAGLEEAQLVQVDMDHLRLNLVVNERFNKDVSLPRLHTVYADKMGGVHIDFGFVSKLEREPSGKIRMVKSLVEAV
jgi:phenylacetate-CoA ligase